MQQTKLYSKKYLGISYHYQNTCVSPQTEANIKIQSNILSKWGIIQFH
jgi:hypothetical protein